MTSSVRTWLDLVPIDGERVKIRGGLRGTEDQVLMKVFGGEIEVRTIENRTTSFPERLIVNGER